MINSEIFNGLYFVWSRSSSRSWDIQEVLSSAKIIDKIVPQSYETRMLYPTLWQIFILVVNF
jgi:hypothetical protein